MGEWDILIKTSVTNLPFMIILSRHSWIINIAYFREFLFYAKYLT